MHSHNLVLLKNEYFEGCNIVVLVNININIYQNQHRRHYVHHCHLVSLIKTKSYFEGYNKTVNPTAASAFTTSAFRFFIFGFCLSS